jgi:hypothetical protein
LGRYFQILRWDVLAASSGSNGTVIGLLLGPEDVSNIHFRNTGKCLPVQTVPEVLNLQQQRRWENLKFRFSMKQITFSTLKFEHLHL